MKITKQQLILFVLISLFLGSFSPAFAAPMLSISPAGDGVYSLQGVGLEDVGGIQVTISYDSTTLGNPRVVQGGLIAGGMMMSNVTVPGSIVIAVISTSAIAGSGTIVTLTFDRKGAQPGKPVVLNVKMVNTSGKNIAGDLTPKTEETVAQPSGNQASPESVEAPKTPVESASSSTSTVRSAGTITLPSADSAPKEKIEAPGQSDFKDANDTSHDERHDVARETGAPAAEEAREPVVAVKTDVPLAPTIQSILERFSTYSGEKSLKSLTALFEQKDLSVFSQIPAVCIADGKSTLKITLFNIVGKKAPNFTLNGASLVSLKRKGDNDWVVEAKPNKGVYIASLTMLLDGTAKNFPLTVAPKIDPDLDKSGTVNEADFNLFIKESGTEKSTRFDFNGDGKRDYQDEYIFVANYLSVLDKKPKVKATKDKTTEQKEKDSK